MCVYDEHLLAGRDIQHHLTKCYLRRIQQYPVNNTYNRNEAFRLSDLLLLSSTNALSKLNQNLSDECFLEHKLKRLT